MSEALQDILTTAANIGPDGHPISAVKALPLIENAANLLADDSIVLPPEIIEGILHKGLKAVLGAGSKDRKTWIVLHIAIAVATGNRFWIWPTVKGKVLYINFEIPRPFIRSRIKTLSQHLGINDISNLDIWTLRGHAAPMEILLPELMAQIETANYTLIIIDPIYKVLGRLDENKAVDIADFLNQMERLAVGTGAAVLYAAHFSKGNQANKEAMDRISGSGVWARDADTLITLTKHKVERAYTVDMILRNHPEQSPFVVEWNFPTMTLQTELNPGQLKQVGGRKAEHDAGDFLDLLPEEGLTNQQWQRAALAKRGISTRTFYRLRKQLEEGKRVRLSQVNDKWVPIKSN